MMVPETRRGTDGRIRVLIVDDDESTCRTLRLIFERQGYETETAGTGREGLETARRSFFNVALVDVKLPDMEGMTLLSPLREMHPDIGMLMVTGYASLESAVEALNEGASAYITKPLNMDEVLGTVREVVEKQRLVWENRRLYEEAQRELAERRRAEERYRSLFEGAEDHIFVVDRDFRFVMANESATRAGGFFPENVVGRGPKELFPEDAEFYIEQYRHVFETGAPARFERELKLPNGSRWFSVTLSPIRDAEGSVTALTGISRDITEHVRMGEELLRIQKLESLGVLAGGIAHDFRNLLTIVLGNVSLVAKDLDPQGEPFGMLADVETAAEEAKELTQQLLAFSKGGDGAPVKKATSIAKLLKETAGLGLRGSGVRCEFLLPDDLWPVVVDSGQIGQVINNLVINAVQAMPKGGVLRIGAENLTLDRQTSLPLKPGRYVQVSVADEGTGIPEEDLSRIFDPYFTTKDSGNGLGLATVYSILRNHEGYITVESEVGTGTRFRFYLPGCGEEAGG